MARLQQQGHMDETALEQPDLEELLERRQDAMPAHKNFTAQHKAAATIVKNLDLAVGKYRVGRFVLNVVEGEEREVEFTRGASKSFRVKLADNGSEE